MNKLIMPPFIQCPQLCLCISYLCAFTTIGYSFLNSHLDCNTVEKLFPHRACNNNENKLQKVCYSAPAVISITITSITKWMSVTYLPWWHTIEEASKLLVLHISNGSGMWWILHHLILCGSFEFTRLHIVRSITSILWNFVWMQNFLLKMRIKYDRRISIVSNNFHEIIKQL